MKPKVRNRVASGRKAALTNLKKSPEYYREIGSMGGLAVAALKRAFSTIPGLASRAAKHRALVKDREYMYIVRAEGYIPETFNVRREAREFKQLLRTEEKVTGPILIKQYHFDETGLIIWEGYIR